MKQLLSYALCITSAVSWGAFGKCLGLRKSSKSHLSVPAEAGIYNKSNKTIMLWLKGEGPSVLLRYGGSDESLHFALAIDKNGHVKFNNHAKVNRHLLKSSESISDGKWHHVAVVVEDNTVQLLVDGIIVVNEKYGADVGKGNPFIIGSSYNHSNNFKGLIDEVQVWNKALTVPQIKKLMFETPEDVNKDGLVDSINSLGFDNLKLFYNFEETSTDGKVKDLSDNNFDGQLQNNSILIDKHVELKAIMKKNITVSFVENELVWTASSEKHIKRYEVLRKNTREVLEKVDALDADEYVVNISDNKAVLKVYFDNGESMLLTPRQR